MRLLRTDTSSTYEELLQRRKQSTLHVSRMRLIALEIFKSINNLNPAFMKDLFEFKMLTHDFRDQHKLVMPSFNTLRYGRNTFTYYGAHLYNSLPAHIKVTEYSTFKNMLNSWEGPRCHCSLCCFIVWSFYFFIFIFYYYIFFILFFLSYLQFYMFLLLFKFIV